MVAQPVVELAKTVGASLHFNTAIDAEERDRNIATKSTTRCATQWDAFGSEAGILQRMNYGAFGAITLISTRPPHVLSPLPLDCVADVLAVNVIGNAGIDSYDDERVH